ncbi:MAG: hypothetical protein JW861_09820 [Bacteroidales bacterium]|nr:hypothetical protein [Bacteroidales bacterium]
MNSHSGSRVLPARIRVTFTVSPGLMFSEMGTTTCPLESVFVVRLVAGEAYSLTMFTSGQSWASASMTAEIPIS